MSEQINPVIVQRTQQKLGKFIQRPQLTDKLLKRPPFRFLHDIVTSAIKQYGVLDETFTSSELVSENIKEKDDKIAFLQKLISKLNSDLGIALRVKPSKIVAGAEADKTNELLQALGSLIEKKQSRQKPPPSHRAQVNGDTNSNSKESKVSTNAPPTNKGTSEATRKEHSKINAKNEPASRQPHAKENGIITNTRPNQERSANEKLIKTTQRTDNDLNGGAKPQLKNNTTRQQTNVAKSKDTPKPQKTLPAKANVKAQNGDHIDVATVPPEDPSIDFDLNKDPLVSNSKPTFDASVRLDSPLRRDSRDNVRSEVISSRPDVRLRAQDDESEDLTADSNDPLITSKSTNEGNFLSFNGTGNDAGKLSPPVTAINNAFEKPIPDRSSSPAAQPKRPPSGANRPKSSRRPPSRAIRDRLSVMRQDSRPVSSQVPRVIIDGNPFSDDEEDKIVESAVFDQSIVNFTAGAGNEFLSGQQGKLVEEILSVQKGVEYSDMDFESKEIGSTNQFQQLKAIIQEMAKAALPLGHLIPLIHEDMETMHQEWVFWKKEADILEEEYNKEKTSPPIGAEKLKAELEQLDKALAEQEAKLSAAKSAVLKSEKDVSLVMANFGKNR